MDEAFVLKIESWIETRAKEVLSAARKRGITHADAVELLSPRLHLSHKLKIIEKATELFLKQKVEEATKLQKRGML